MAVVAPEVAAVATAPEAEDDAAVARVAAPLEVEVEADDAEVVEDVAVLASPSITH